MKEKITAWLARDINGDLNAYTDELYKGNGTQYLEMFNEGRYFALQRYAFPQVKWEDKEATKVELTIKIYE